MEKVLLNFSLILILVYFYKITRHGLHILQLENYYLDRYVVWIKKNIKKVISIRNIILLLMPIICFIIIKSGKLLLISYIIEILVFIYLIIKTKKPKEKKAFVVTARIKRVYVTYLVLFVLVAVIANIFDGKYALIFLNICAIFAYFFVYIVNLINRPIEKSIRKGFCIKAKKKLKEIPNLKVIGITGSYGKTSTKYVINTILSQKYNTLMTPESYNTTMGVVRTINEKLTSLHQLFICEMGAKYVGDIKEITDIVEPTYGVLTAIGPQHLDTFKSLENVKKTKLELVDSLPEDGIAFVNWEDENIRNSNITKNVVKFGLSKEADYYATNINITERGSNFDVVIPGKAPIKIRTRLLGDLNVLNVVGAVAIADKLGLSENEIKAGAKYIRPVPHRLELKQNANGSIIIDDAYNSNVKGANMALEVLKSFVDKKRILITPGIVELGNKSEEINKELGKKSAKCCDYIILVGAQQTVPIYNGIIESGYPESQLYIAKNLQDALSQMNKIITPNSVVLLENDLPDNYL